MVRRRTAKEGAGGGRWLFKHLGGTEGGPTGAGAWQREKEERGPGCGGRSARQPATAPGRRAQATTLSRNRGE
jgi:hypothetical protein